MACRANRLFIGLRIISHLLGTYCSLLVDQSAASELPWGQTAFSAPCKGKPMERKGSTTESKLVFKKKKKKEALFFPRCKFISLSSSDAAANKFFTTGCGFYPGLANVALSD